MSGCYILKGQDINHIQELSRFLCFKYQYIFGIGKHFNEIIGSQFIIDIERTKQNGLNYHEFNHIISLGGSDHASLNYASIYKWGGGLFCYAAYVMFGY